MLPNLRTALLAGVVSLGGLLAAGARPAEAQLIVSTPGATVGLGTPVGLYPGYGAGAYPYVYPPTYGVYGVRPAPLVVAPAPVVVPAYPRYYGGYPRYYGGYPRYYGGYRGGYGYRRW